MPKLPLPPPPWKVELVLDQDRHEDLLHGPCGPVAIGLRYETRGKLTISYESVPVFVMRSGSQQDSFEAQIEVTMHSDLPGVFPLDALIEAANRTHKEIADAVDPVA